LSSSRDGQSGQKFVLIEAAAAFVAWPLFFVLAWLQRL